MMPASGSDPNYDLIIAGGGMIGTSLALALAPLGLDIAVVEAVPRGAPAQPSFDDRSTALSRSTRRMYGAMGLWPEISAGATPITRIHVSDKGRFGFSHIDAAEQGVEALGYVVINRVLGQVLDTALENSAAVDVFRPASVVAVQAGPDRAAVEIETGGGEVEELRGRLLVAADGASSAVRDMLGIGARRIDYGQIAVIGNLLTEKPIANCAYERFTEQGPLALLPISEGRSGFVWTLSAPEAERVTGLDDADFTAALQDAFDYRLGSLSRIGSRSAYPLMLSKADRLTAPRAVLVGNAAHGLHPVAAQGFNLGLRDVAALVDCIVDDMTDSRHLDRHPDPGAAGLLARYADWRRSDQQKLVGFTDGLVRLFGQSNPAVRVARDAGMIAFDLLPGVRRAFARHTMGLAGHLPRLSRGVPIE